MVCQNAPMMTFTSTGEVLLTAGYIGTRKIPAEYKNRHEQTPADHRGSSIGEKEACAGLG
jgi:hypothetical protein